MSTPVARSVLTEPGPLGPAPDTATDPQDASLAPLSSSPHSPPSASSGPLSFKRRAAQARSGRDKSSRGGILGSILSRSNDDDDQHDMVPNPPTLRRPDAPSHIALPPGSHVGESAAYRRTGASDEEDDDELSPGAGGALGGKGWRRRLPSAAAQRRMLSASAGAAGGGAGPRSRRSTGASAFLSPSKEPGMLSPTYSPSARGGDGGGGAGDGAFPGDAGPIVVTPLPKIPIFVLSICMLGEFLSASVCSPFLFFMVESFGVGENGGGESAVSLWTGVVAAVFFLSQFLTAMIWVSVADKHGRRAVLCASLLGNGLTVMAFGTSRNLGTAICTRLAMGLFNGAVGVARSAVQDVTDESNRSTAYTILGLLWGMGGIVGSVLGGTLEHPVEKYPRYFGDSHLFAEYPYLLPCMVAGSVTLFGGVISLGLNRDGGQREGGIHLPTEKDVEVAAGTLARIKDWFLARTSSLLARLPRRPPIHLAHSSGAVSLHPSSADVPPLPSPAESPEITDDAGRGREPSRHQGSAYGYASSRRASQVNFERDSGLRIPSMRRRGFRSTSMATTSRYDADSEVPHSFAERLLLAQNQAVFSLSDVFLAKAAADDDFHAVEYDGSVFERDDDEESRIEGVDHDGANSEYEGVGFGTAPPSMDDLRGEAARQAAQAPVPPFARPGSPSHSLAPQQQPRAPRRGTLLSPTRDRIVSHATNPSRQRRVSTSSSARPMSIYDNSGLAPETIASAAGQLVAQHQQQLSAPTTPDESRFSPMAAIPETRAASIIEHGASDDDASTVIDYGGAGVGGGPSAAAGDVGSGANSVVWQLPLAMIAQYLCVGMHGTACDQMFTSFLVTPIASGGLGLSADHYAALVATMFFFSLIWQFRFYSAVGPPNGSLSHLSMFRLGLILYVPVYLLFPELRGLVGDGDKVGLVMLGMIVLSAIRYLANACAYTAVMVLINVMTPPELVPLANGLAQSCISLARFIGPLLGGSVFAASIADPANAHPSAGFHLIAALCFFGFVLSWRIK
ncbi:uncharacterized protein RHOBADRAFT_53461 [Rhodotorula graminis WP1]|uniref:Major facilitator superfamily (MFS) profile domain-containing protein n=1 Tax=Rhodotorula graminis (strain WP1) TaxID=578459 RepID=A0A194S4P4_RHOGW|nr:uncharacterized protein RHOBADRAFT_53461 [Rhodotorula graminis WP1]KPV75489.1 hypothetical protein RHOBADRAFT_53461 [Rhodotorula graminis WP1]